MKEANAEAHDWLEKIPTHLWSRHCFNPVSKVDLISNNISESFNGWITKLRDLPILTLLEEYRLKVMKLMNSRYQKATKWTGKLVPHVVKGLNQEWVFARKFDIIEAGQGEFQCKDGMILRVVNLKK